MYSRFLGSRWRACCAFALTAFMPVAVMAAAQRPVPSTSATAQQPIADRAFVERYCVTCHSQRLHTGGLVLEGLDPSRASENIVTWEKVVRKVRVGVMPPATARQPDRASAEVFVSELEASLDRAAEAHPSSRVPPIHRLNRTEYRNAIRDLLAVDNLPK